MQTRAPRFRRFALGAACLGAVLLPGLAVAGEALEVMIDFAKLMKLDQPAASVIIGNSGIADATIADATTVILTGKATGTTNLIVLGRDGKEVANIMLQVVGNRRQLATVFYGKKRATFSCSPVCENVVAIGDDSEVFGTADTQIRTRNAFAGN